MAQDLGCGGSGSESIRGRRSTRSSEQGSSVALLWKSPGYESEGQQVGDVGALSSMQSTSQLHQGLGLQPRIQPIPIREMSRRLWTS